MLDGKAVLCAIQGLFFKSRDKVSSPAVLSMWWPPPPSVPLSWKSGLRCPLERHHEGHILSNLEGGVVARSSFKWGRTKISL